MNPQSIRDYKVLLFFIALLWIIELINLLIGHQLNQFALRPRDLSGVYGIFTVHFLHWDFAHLLSNSIPLAFLGFLVCATGRALVVTVTIMLSTGVAVWLFARNGLHAGASGLVMGYWGYLISNALFDRSLKNLFIGIITIALYGGIVFSLLDFRATTSFEGHLFGFAAGVAVAWGYSKRLGNNKKLRQS